MPFAAWIKANGLNSFKSDTKVNARFSTVSLWWLDPGTIFHFSATSEIFRMCSVAVSCETTSLNPRCCPIWGDKHLRLLDISDISCCLLKDGGLFDCEHSWCLGHIAIASILWACLKVLLISSLSTALALHAGSLWSLVLHFWASTQCGVLKYWYSSDFWTSLCSILLETPYARLQKGPCSWSEGMWSTCFATWMWKAFFYCSSKSSHAAVCLKSNKALNPFPLSASFSDRSERSDYRQMVPPSRSSYFFSILPESKYHAPPSCMVDLQHCPSADVAMTFLILPLAWYEPER